MAFKYCSDPRTIILCVIPANIDLSTSEALSLARKWDEHGQRTLGVVTKIDIMNPGSNAKKTLLNQEVVLKLGYVGVKCRNQEETTKGKPVKDGLKDEKEFFRSHPDYRGLPSDCYGTDTLVQKLSKIMFTQIRIHLPTIIKEIESKQKEIETVLKDLGTPLPSTETEKMQTLWKLVNNFSESFRSKISGKYDAKLLKAGQKRAPIEMSGGAKIKLAFYSLYSEYADTKYKPTLNLMNKDIENAIILSEGDNLSNSPHRRCLLLFDPARD